MLKCVLGRLHLQSFGYYPPLPQLQFLFLLTLPCIQDTFTTQQSPQLPAKVFQSCHDQKCRNFSTLSTTLCCQAFSPCSQEGNGQSAALCRVWFSIQQVSGLRRAGGSAMFCLIDAQLLQVTLQVQFTDQLSSSLQNPKVKGVIQPLSQDVR